MLSAEVPKLKATQAARRNSPPGQTVCQDEKHCMSVAHDMSG